MVTLFSKKFQYADIEIWYRTDFGESWKDDIFITSHTGKFIKDNKVFRLPCSSDGQENVIRWQYEKNDLTSGNSCQIKIKAVPSVLSFNYYDPYTTMEYVYTNTFNEINGIIPYKIFGLNNYGNYMGFDTNKFIIVNKNNEIIMEYAGIQNLICVQQIYNDNYILLDNIDCKIIEISSTGDLIYELQSFVLFDNPWFFIYDQYVNNVLLTDKDKNIIYEISWDEGTKGDIIWQHGTYGSGTTQLDAPTSSIYDTENRAIIWAADSGNKRIKKIDRSSFADVITAYNYFTKDTINIEFNPILKMFSSQDKLITVDAEPEEEYFNTNINLHPALSRAMDLKEGATSTKNNLDDYSNLIMLPASERDYDS